ncbi:MAG: tail fiber domain-containing protein [Pyrinomonadaceae bacterium]|nr:tail fiber domain-containing protein [Pyrinomonadaceae bacterium]
MKRLIFTIAVFAIMAPAITAQTNDFTYQGTLNLSGSPANGSYDFEFRLFDAADGGAQVGSTATRSGVTVTNGVFSVALSFVGAFSGTDRWLEIWVRPSGGVGYQTLAPRVKLTSAPYAIRSQAAETAASATSANNASSLGGVAASQYVQTTDPRMTDARPPTPGSGNYIQNTVAQQATSNFNISGNGTAGGTLSANEVRTETTFTIGADRFMATNAVGRGVLIGKGTGNGGGENSFIGWSSGELITTGNFNTFVGSRTGISNTTGNANSFFGLGAGDKTVSGSNNTFVGVEAGDLNTIGSNNTALGFRTDVATGELDYATAIGAGTVASLSNSIYLGRPTGADTVRIPGNLNLIGAASLNGNLVVASGGLSVFNGNVIIPSLGSAGATSLCRNASNILATCSSSLRYKTNVNPFASGLDLIRRLQPITFDWKDGGMNDLGLGAEDVAAIEPLLVTYNKDGQVEGVKYDRIGVVLINAIKEQQRQIDAQRDEIQALRAALCELRPGLAVCNPQEKK